MGGGYVIPFLRLPTLVCNWGELSPLPPQLRRLSPMCFEDYLAGGKEACCQSKKPMHVAPHLCYLTPRPIFSRVVA